METGTKTAESTYEFRFYPGVDKAHTGSFEILGKQYLTVSVFTILREVDSWWVVWWSINILYLMMY